jgi:hypothetical protein
MIRIDTWKVGDLRIRVTPISRRNYANFDGQRIEKYEKRLSEINNRPTESCFT